MDKTIFYNFNHVYSFNSQIIIIIGGRGIGKTYGTKKKFIKDFIFKDKKFVWVRDSESACDELRANNGDRFFADVRHEFGESFTGTIKNEVITINGKFAGYLMPLSTYYKYKGNSYAEIKNICFDEFMPEQSQIIRSNRTVQFVNTVETIGRLRKDYRIVLLANALNRGDEILNLFNFNIKDYGYYINREKSCVLHYCENDAKFDAARADSISGKILKNTVYEQNIAYNKFRDELAGYFDKLPPNAQLFCYIVTETRTARLYTCGDTVYAVSQKGNISNSLPAFVRKIEMVDSRHTLINKILLDGLKAAYLSNTLLCDNASTREIVVEYLK